MAHRGAGKPECPTGMGWEIVGRISSLSFCGQRRAEREGCRETEKKVDTSDLNFPCGRTGATSPLTSILPGTLFRPGST